MSCERMRHQNFCTFYNEMETEFIILSTKLSVLPCGTLLLCFDNFTALTRFLIELKDTPLIGTNVLMQQVLVIKLFTLNFQTLSIFTCFCDRRSEQAFTSVEKMFVSNFDPQNNVCILFGQNNRIKQCYIISSINGNKNHTCDWLIRTGFIVPCVFLFVSFIKRFTLLIRVAPSVSLKYNVLTQVISYKLGLNSIFLLDFVFVLILKSAFVLSL